VVGNKDVRLKVPLAFRPGKRSRDDFSGGSHERHALVTNHLVFNIEVQLGLGRARGFGEIELIAVLQLAGCLKRQIPLRGNNLYFLIRVSFRRGDPDADASPSRKIPHAEGVVKREVAGVLGQGG